MLYDHTSKNQEIANATIRVTGRGLNDIYLFDTYHEALPTYRTLCETCKPGTIVTIISEVINDD